MKNVKRRFDKRNIILSHINKNAREYIVSGIIFIIGILFGVMFVNNSDNSQNLEITSYLTDSINLVKENKTIEKAEVIKESIKENIKLSTILWLMGSTIIGIVVVYIIICFKGFCFGYTLSSVIHILGTGKGIIIFFSTMFLKNIIVIPCIIAIGVSGMKISRVIVEENKKENIKLEILRHTFFSILILIALILSSFIEAYTTPKLLQWCTKYL